VRERGRWVQHQVSLVLAAVRRVERLPRVAITAVAALALLTTFSAAPGAPDRATVPASSGEVPFGQGDETTREVAAAPEFADLLAADVVEGTDELPEIPELGGDRELSPFTQSLIGDVAEDEVVAADLILRAEEGRVDPETLAEPLVGTQHAAPAAGLTASTPAGDEDREVSLLGVDGTAFRPLTPEVTASADGVWERFSEGDVLVSHELAQELDLELGGDLLLATEDASFPVRIGAFAANGAPQLADILVPIDVAAELGVTSPNTLVVAVGSGDPAAVGDALAEATDGEVEVRRELAPPVADQAPGRAQLQQHAPRGRIEPFTYTSHTDGRITIHGDWVARNITRVQLPGMPATSCHKAMVPQLMAAVDELIARDLYSHLDPSQFAGCFVARHIDWRPDRPLSMHAWGLAIDFNTRDNWLGAQPKMDPRVVQVFKNWGFDWGGDWRRPDGMHFELARIVQVP
jgi:hypothetical protein